MQNPEKHHFLPVFYLKQWASDGGHVVEFSKPYGNTVRPRRVHPKGTGYILRLYVAEGLPEELAFAMESKFLSPVDSRAAEALVAMLLGAEFTSAQRLAWAAFVATLLLRMPEDIDLIKRMVRELYTTFAPVFEPLYQRHIGRQENTFEQLTEQFIVSSPDRAIAHAQRIMSNEKLTAGIAGMEWSVLTLDRAKHSLLTSDRPVVYTNVLGHENSHMVLPIGPRRIFVAVKERSFIQTLKALGEDQLVALTNIAVTQSADKYVYGEDDKQMRFVQNRMGTKKTPQLIERAWALQREQYFHLLSAFREAQELHTLDSDSGKS